MQQFGGKDSKRHFTVVMGGKEHGLYVSSTPSSAARKAVTKLCAANKSKKVEFHMREITQDSKKKTYGPYEGYIEKLKEPIELNGRVIKYKPVAKLSGKSGAKKGGMWGGANKLDRNIPFMFHIYRPKDIRFPEVQSEFPVSTTQINTLDPNIFIQKYIDKNLIIPESIEVDKTKVNELKIFFKFVKELTDREVLATLRDNVNKKFIYTELLKQRLHQFNDYTIYLCISYYNYEINMDKSIEKCYKWLSPPRKTGFGDNTNWNSNNDHPGIHQLRIPFLETNSKIKNLP